MSTSEINEDSTFETYYSIRIIHLIIDLYSFYQRQPFS